MAKRDFVDEVNTATPKLNAGEIRRKYQTKLKDILKDIQLCYKQTDTLIHTKLILRAYAYLYNFGLMTDYDALSIYNFYKNNMPEFIEGIQKYIEDENNKTLIYKTIYLISHLCSKIEGIQKNYYYADFLEDLMVIAGIKVKNKFFNFIEKGIYSNPEETSEYYVNFLKNFKLSKQKLVNSFTDLTTEEEKQNIIKNKQVLMNIKGAVNG